ncbi:acetyltransferase [Micrococcales bacterium 31B]|nr:acetyltransferase [Micrococcales bacterium 31B]
MSKVRVAILGAGGFGREVYGYLRDIAVRDEGFAVAGFIDSNPAALEGFSLPGNPAIIASGLDAAVGQCEAVVIALGDPGLRARFRGEAAAVGLDLFTVTHPLAYVATTATVGAGSILAPFVTVNDCAEVQENTAINCYASVGHDARLEADAVLSPYATLNGFAVVGRQALLGTHCAVLPGVSVGAFSKVAAGVAVSRPVEPGSLVAGAAPKSRVMFAVPESDA